MRRIPQRQANDRPEASSGASAAPDAPGSQVLAATVGPTEIPLGPVRLA